jgi:hypothetical protein
MSPSPLPARITIDFRDAILPSRSWILGLGGRSTRVELLAFEDVPAAEAPMAMLALGPDADCTCPEFCERDHANE